MIYETFKYSWWRGTTRNGVTHPAAAAGASDSPAWFLRFLLSNKSVKTQDRSSAHALCASGCTSPEFAVALLFGAFFLGRGERCNIVHSLNSSAGLSLWGDKKVCLVGCSKGTLRTPRRRHRRGRRPTLTHTPRQVKAVCYTLMLADKKVAQRGAMTTTPSTTQVGCSSC